jgi:lipoprotein-releasing system permease protein
MSIWFRLSIALRYVLTREQAPLSRFLSVLSVTGLVLAVALMAVVMSVMNGFDQEMRTRVLAVIPHVSVMGAGGLEPQGLSEQLLSNADVQSVTPFVELQGLVQNGRQVEAFVGVGVADPRSWVLPSMISVGEVEQGVWVGERLGQRLGANLGDRVSLVIPDAGDQKARAHTVTIAGWLSTQTEADDALMLIPLQDAQHFVGFETSKVSGLKVQLQDVFLAPWFAQGLQYTLAPNQYVRHWGMTHGNLYAAIQLSRDLIVILVAAVVLIAAFNVVSSLVLLVSDKREEVAILSTMGLQPSGIASVFLWLGTLIGVVGSALGVALGYALSTSITSIVASIEQIFGVHFLNTDVYPIAFLPTDPQLGDFVLVGLIAIIACALAAVYPAHRAAHIAPAEVLSEA